MLEICDGIILDFYPTPRLSPSVFIFVRAREEPGNEARLSACFSTWTGGTQETLGFSTVAVHCQEGKKGEVHKGYFVGDGQVPRLFARSLDLYS